MYRDIAIDAPVADLQQDPQELADRADDPAYAEVRERLTQFLVSRLYGSDQKWIDNDRLVGGAGADIRARSESRPLGDPGRSMADATGR